ncbi:MAG: ATP synthase F1 subunit gamma [Chloroflexi bacterium]|nr:ATP synthase F1 subunit gamma [Chloroflexota bacterium]
MPNIRQIKRRIRSVQSTAKITKAMEMIAASKMRKAQQRGLAGRPYAYEIMGVLAHLAAQPGDDPHPFLIKREVKRTLVILVTADRGLCGGLNSNMNRAALAMVTRSSVPLSFVVVGRRGRDFVVRSGWDLRAEFTNLGDAPSQLETLPIARVALDDYLTGYVDEVFIAYSEFINTAVQRPKFVKILPVEPAPIPPEWNVEYIYEPSAELALAALLPRYIEMQVHHAVLENLASEQSARMVAMRNASDAAKDMIKGLTLTYNKTRQESITKELLDLVGGAAALEG